ncbi:MAG: DUF305 domain-containing protein [Terriglobales bacterium]
MPAGPKAPNVVQAGAPGQPSRVLADGKVPAFPAPVPTMADIMFMQGMIEHHAQALAMCALINARTRNPQLQSLGKKIQISQSEEIGLMDTWLRNNHKAQPVTAADGRVSLNGTTMAPMAGMLSPAQMRALAAAQGAAFDHLFLTGMIQHHRGALSMVFQLRHSPGAVAGAGMHLLATLIYNDQTTEIHRMQGMLGIQP